MVRWARIVVLAASLSACGDAEMRNSVAKEARSFLVAAQSQDRKTFYGHLDRKALRADIRTQLEAQAR